MLGQDDYRSEIRESVVRDMLEKTRKGNFGRYLASLRLERIRMFAGAQVTFQFPVTALIGPNGGGKSTVLNACACAYSPSTPSKLFRKSRVGDASMDDWLVEYEAIDKSINKTAKIRFAMSFADGNWHRTEQLTRDTRMLGIARTVPATESPTFSLRKKLSSMTPHPGEATSMTSNAVDDISPIRYEAERILGKSLQHFHLLEITSTTIKQRTRKRLIERQETTEDGRPVEVHKFITLEAPAPKKIIAKQRMYIGGDGKAEYSEFNFGAGEASVIRTVAEIESASDGSLILVEEIENGLHPLAVRRLVEYLINAAMRKSVQVVFTTHSDYAIAPLPPEAVWAALDGQLQQGKLSIDVLRAVSGRIDKRLAVFVEDEFARAWVESIIREKVPENFEEVGIYAVHGDSHAVRVHEGHTSNPAVRFHSLCFLDGDSRQKDDEARRIFRLPGAAPESAVFDAVLRNLDDNVALLTAACHRPLDRQSAVAEAIRKVSHTNRDPHLLFSQVGAQLQFLPEAIVRGAFLTVWAQENPNDVQRIAEQIKAALALPSKSTG